jgi:metal-dependent amidase/aminoacylase/carboxypeptidase family protein
MHTSARSAFLHCSRTTSLTSRTAVYGPVRTVVWQGSAGDCRPYADLNLQSIVSRTINPYHSAVVTVGVIQGGLAANVIPESVILKGTARWFDAKTGQSLQSTLERIVRSTAETYGASAVMTTRLVAPVTVNDQQAMNMARRAAGAIAGEDHVRHLEEPIMGGEDFGFMLQVRQGAYILLGSNRPAADNWNLHHPRYDFNDEVLTLGASYWSALVEQQLAVK